MVAFFFFLYWMERVLCFWFLIFDFRVLLEACCLYERIFFTTDMIL